MTTQVLVWSYSPASAWASFRMALASNSLGNYAGHGCSTISTWLFFPKTSESASRIKAFFLKRAGQHPSKCAHVGDNLGADVQASHQSGLRSVWVDRLGKNSDFPAQRITSL